MDHLAVLRSLALSFLNSSYSGLSVGSSSLHNGQVLVCSWTHRARTSVQTVDGNRPDVPGVVLTFFSQGRMQEEWKRCLQGIWCSFSFFLNFSRHTGHLTPLSGGPRQDKFSDCWLHPQLEKREGSPEPTCFLLRQDDYTEGLDSGLGGWRRKTLFPV